MDVLPDRLVALLGPADGAPQPLAGGITNTNWRVRLGGRDYVVRQCTPGTEILGIDRSDEHEASRRAAELGIGPPLAAWLPEEGVLVTHWLDGGPLTAEELRDPAVLAVVAPALRRFHDGPPLRTPFWVPDLVREQREEIVAAGGEVPALYDAAVALADRIAAALGGAEHERVPCHNDLLLANFVRDGATVRIVDWEYAGMNDRFFDLANMSVNNGFGEDDDRVLLQAYFGEPASGARFAALRLMRLVSDLREAMWGAVQAVGSPLEGVDFPAYAEEHFARLEAGMADPRVEGWLAEAAA
jgi:thiamine kinase-like enzyme